jgi:hypothetical protein
MNASEQSDQPEDRQAVEIALHVSAGESGAGRWSSGVRPLRRPASGSSGPPRGDTRVNGSGCPGRGSPATRDKRCSAGRSGLHLDRALLLVAPRSRTRGSAVSWCVAVRMRLTPRSPPESAGTETA